MNCYVCDRVGDATAAVGLCDCGVALCRRHFHEEARFVGAGGTGFDCSHTRLAAPLRRAAAVAPEARAAVSPS